jgi:cytochrome c biogenesis protein
MAQDVRSQPLAGGTDAERSFTGVDVVLEKLWHALTSMRVALILMLLMAAVAVIGALVVQAPAGVLGDPAAKADWLDQIRPKYGGWTNSMDTLGLFAVFNSIWFRAIVVLLTASLIACSVQRIPGLWKTAMHPHPDVGQGFFDHAPQHETFTVVGDRDRIDVASSVTDVFKKHHYRVVSADDGVVHVYADKHRFVGFASLAGHLSIVLILLGAMAGTLFGYRDGQFIIAEGQTLAVPAQAGMTIKLDAFRDSYYADTGAPSDYASDVVLYQDGKEVERHTIRVNDPMRAGDISFYQAFYGPAAVMKVADSSGKTLVDEGVPLAWTTSQDGRRVGSLSIPGAGLVAWVIGTNGDQDTVVKPGQMRVEVYKADDQATPVASQTIDQGKPTEVGGVTFTFLRESQFTGLSVSKDPGVMLVWLGGFLLFAGFVLVFTLPHRRIWARIAPRPNGGATVALAAAGRKDVTQGTEFADVIVDVRAALAAPRQG